jgi:hypothetical protein
LLIGIIGWLFYAGFSYLIISKGYIEDNEWTVGKRNRWITICLLTGPFMFAFLFCIWIFFSDKPAKW